ncbi:MAG: 7-carboxy-7-deazaguanine synthase QueE [Verrucomicrobiota bacterium]
MKIARLTNGQPEIFYSVQGEGRFTGRPSVFVRSSLCNLSCEWCDTPYTWDWERYDRSTEILDLSPEEVARLAKKWDCSNYVFTGGDPLIQHKQWAEVIDHIGDSHIEIETNGTLLPPAGFIAKVDQFNVSPKLAHSGVAAEKREQIDVLSALAKTGKADFKFVIADESDLEEVLDLQARAHLPSEHIFLMPKGTTVNEIDRSLKFLTQIALDQGFHLSDRLHVRLFGDSRGT